MPYKRPKLLTNFNSPRRDFAFIAKLTFTGALAHGFIGQTWLTDVADRRC